MSGFYFKPMSIPREALDRLREAIRRIDEAEAEIAAILGGAQSPKKAPPAGKQNRAKGNGVKHACCGSKQTRHKKSCDQGDGKLPPEKPATKAQSVKCIDCDWKGAVSGHADIHEIKCPDCKGQLIAK